MLVSSLPAQTAGNVFSVGLNVPYVGAAVGAAVGALVMVGAGLVVGDAEGSCVSISAVTLEQSTGISSVGPILRLAPAANASFDGPRRATPRASADDEEISSSGSWPYSCADSAPEISTYALSDGAPGGIQAAGSSKLAERRCGFRNALSAQASALGLAVGGEVGKGVGAGVVLGAAVVGAIDGACTSSARLCFAHVAGMDSVWPRRSPAPAANDSFDGPCSARRARGHIDIHDELRLVGERVRREPTGDLGELGD